MLIVGASAAPASSKAIEPKPVDYIDMVPIEASVEEDAKCGGYMVVGPRAKTSAEIGARERQSLSTEHVVEFRENDDDSGPNLKSNAAATVSAHLKENHHPHGSAAAQLPQSNRLAARCF